MAKKDDVKPTPTIGVSLASLLAGSGPLVAVIPDPPGEITAVHHIGRDEHATLGTFHESVAVPTPAARTGGQLVGLGDVVLVDVDHVKGPYACMVCFVHPSGEHVNVGGYNHTGERVAYQYVGYSDGPIRWSWPPRI